MWLLQWEATGLKLHALKKVHAPWSGLQAGCHREWSVTVTEGSTRTLKRARGAPEPEGPWTEAVCCHPDGARCAVEAYTGS